MTTVSQTDRTIAAYESEAVLLGAMMIDTRVIDRNADRLRPEHFYDPVHAKIYKVLLHLRSAGDTASPVTARLYFEKDDLLKERGGPRYLAELTGSGAGLIAAQTSVDQLIRFATYRELRETLRAGIEDLETGVYGKTDRSIIEYLDHEFPDPVDIAANVSSAVLSVVEADNPQKIVSMGKLLNRVRERRQRALDGVSVGAICYTLPEIHDLIGPAAPGQMTIIGGRSGMGKTIVANTMAWGFAVNGHPTLSLALEMTPDMLAMRSAADLTFAMNEPVLFGDIVRNRISDSDLKSIDEAARRIEQYPLTTLTPGRITIEQIEALVAREVSRLARLGRKLEVVVVDYLQIIAATGKLDGTARVNHISEGLLRIAQRFDLHVFALSQLLRDIDKRVDRRPTSADLKESGRLEEDSDNVILIYRAEHYLVKEQPNPKTEEKKWEEWDIAMGHARGMADLLCVKSRSAEPDTRRLKFFGKHQAVRSNRFHLPNFVSEGIMLPADGRVPAMEEAIDGLDFSKMAMP